MRIQWKQLFRPQILKRGQVLADKGAVYHLKVTGEELTALVEGTEIYEVSLSLKPGETEVMYCSCPYAANNNYCKHMAAVMYAYEETSSQSKTAKKHRSQQRSNISAYHPQPNNVQELKQEINTIFRKRKDRSGFVNYFQGGKLYRELSWFLDTSVDTLLKQGDYDTAFSVTAHLFQKLGTTSIDDDGTIGFVSDQCYRVWKTIATNGTAAQRTKMRKWMEQRIEQAKIYDYMLDYLEEFITYELWDDASAKQEIAELDEQIAEVEANIETDKLAECPRQYLAYRGSKELVLLRLEWMNTLDYTPVDIANYKKAHKQFRVLRELEVNELLSAGQKELTAESLKECIALSAPKSRHVEKYYSQLASIYHDLGWVKQERDIKRTRMLQSNYITIHEYKELKALYEPLEWFPVSEELLASVINIETKCQLLLEEGHMDALFHTVLESGDITLLNKYGPLFAPDAEKSKAILELYKAHVEKLAERARNIPRYEELGTYLKRMQKYVGGDVLVHNLTQNWITKYPTRKQMVNLLETF